MIPDTVILALGLLIALPGLLGAAFLMDRAKYPCSTPPLDPERWGERE
jgi:hypothetical protein